VGTILRNHIKHILVRHFLLLHSIKKVNYVSCVLISSILAVNSTCIYTLSVTYEFFVTLYILMDTSIFITNIFINHLLII